MPWRAREPVARHPMNGGGGGNVAPTQGAITPMWARPRVLGLGALLTVSAAVAALRWRDPHVPGAWGYCPWLLTTGTPCPTCGGLRAVADLTAGRLASAWAYHPYLVVSIATLGLVLAALPVVGRYRDPGRWLAAWWWRILALWVGGLMVFGVVRALGLWSWPGGPG